MYVLYSDGGAIGNPGIAGYGFVIVKDGTIEQQGGGSQVFATNNQMELMACLCGLRKIPDGNDVTVYSDSQYLVKTMKGEFATKKNLNLWEQLFKERDRLGNIDWNWVKGHADNEFNNLCDHIVKENMKNLSETIEKFSKDEGRPTIDIDTSLF